MPTCLDALASSLGWLAPCTILVFLRSSAVVDATPASFWSAAEGAAKYDADLAKKRWMDPEKHAGRTWRDDRIEKARRVWEWWKAKAPKLN